MKLSLLVILLCSCALAQNPASSNAAAAEFAPGVAIPEKGLVFALDKSGSAPKLEHIVHSMINFNRHVASNLAKSNFTLMMAKPKATLDIAGVQARYRTKDAAPTIFLYAPLREEEDLGSDLGGSWGLVRAIPDGDHRIVGVFVFGRLTGIPSSEYKKVPCHVERFNSEWLKIVPVAPLEPGEYALTRFPERKDIFEPAVFDFAVDK